MNTELNIDDSVTTERLWRILDDMQRQVEDPTASIPSPHQDLTLLLRKAWLELGLEAFRQGVPRAQQHPVLARLHEDPFLRHSFERPRGYPGDAELLDFIYGVGRAGDKVAKSSTWGQRMAQVSHGAPACRAVRARIRLLAERIAARLERGPARVLSLACGHLQEAAHLERSTGLELWALDQDPRSLAEAERRHGREGFRFERASVRGVLKGQLPAERLDLAYAAGLYDYLDDAVAARLTQVLFSRLAPGGALLIPNFVPGCVDVGYMELIMDWQLIYRDEADLEVLAHSALPGEAFGLRTWRGPEGQIAYAELTKPT
ncbi:MAG: class I SAM-dependent methyltransferase [Alphaproteobacteria bacterium]|nr:class I SAM-dependent methyltransferase [Alphaproteobacteria bacterium]